MIPIYAATGAFNSRRLKEALVEAREAGCSRVELSSGLIPEACDADLARVARKDGMEFLVHNYYPIPDVPFVLNLASEKPDSLCFCEKAIDLCQELDCSYYSVHSGFGVELEPADLGNPRSFHYRRATAQHRLSRETFHAAVEKLGDYARNRGVTLLLENNVVDGSLDVDDRSALFLSEPEEIVQYFSNKMVTAGLLLDLAHLEVTCRTLGLDFDRASRQLAPLVTGLHVSSAKGGRDCNAILTEDSPEYRVLRHFAPVFAVLEVYRIGPGAIRDQMALLSKGLAGS